MNVSSRKGGFLVYIKSSLSSKILTKFKLSHDIQIISFELNLEQKLLFVSIISKQSILCQYFKQFAGFRLN